MPGKKQKEEVLHVRLKPPTICRELKMFVYKLNWLRVERLFKKGGHSVYAEWKGKNINLLAIEGYARQRDRINADKNIMARVRKTRIYTLEKALDFFSTNFTRYLIGLEAKNTRRKAKNKITK